MQHNIPLITTIAAGFGMALIPGFIAERIKIPALVGYGRVGRRIASALETRGIRYVVVATPDALDARQMADTARTLNPAIEIVLRSHNEDESQLLRQEGIGTVFFGEEELAKSMTGHVLERFEPQAQCVAAASGHA